MFSPLLSHEQVAGHGGLRRLLRTQCLRTMVCRRQVESVEFSAGRKMPKSERLPIHMNESLENQTGKFARRFSTKRFHIDRATGGHCHHRNPGGLAVAGLGQGQAIGSSGAMCQQSSPMGGGVCDVCQRFPKPVSQQHTANRDSLHDVSYMSPVFMDTFFPDYLYKSNAGNTGTGVRTRNDVLYCPADAWHRQYEAAEAIASGVTNLIGYCTLPCRTTTALYSYTAQYNTFKFGQWFARTKLGSNYRNAPVMCDDIELNGGSWFANPPLAVSGYSYSGPVSAHVNNGGLPLGGNFLFEDWHVEWIKFVIGRLNSFTTIRPAAHGPDSRQYLFSLSRPIWDRPMVKSFLR